VTPLTTDISPGNPELPPGLGKGQVGELVSTLCRWFDEHRRELPWRSNPEPYSVWISEAMLQQTRVETVLDYHRRFLEAFPDVRSLAAAEEAQVLALWSGLGYYRRARSLHAAARAIVGQHGGRIPAERASFLALPGVGPYTAGAVLSIAFQQSEALVDGNVARVFARIFGLRGQISSGPLQRKLWSIARRLVPPAHVPRADEALPQICPGHWNQALMELGALVCLPKSPRCGECPLLESCVAKREGTVSSLPEKAPKRAPLRVEIEALVVERGGEVLLFQRPAGGRMEGLWELPTRECPGPDGLAHGLWPVSFGGPSPCRGDALGVLSHAITKHRIQCKVFRAGWSRSSLRAVPVAQRWVRRDQLAQLGITGLTSKCLSKFGPEV